MVRLQAADVAVVDDDADFNGLADLVDVCGDPVLIGLGEVVGEEEDTLRTEAFGFLSVLDGHAGRAAGAGENRDEPIARIDGGFDNR